MEHIIVTLDVYPDDLYQVRQSGNFGYIVSDLICDFNNEGVCISSEYCLCVLGLFYHILFISSMNMRLNDNMYGVISQPIIICSELLLRTQQSHSSMEI